MCAGSFYPSRLEPISLFFIMTTAETTAAATQDAPAEKPADIRALLKTLQERFEGFRNFRPLAIGID